VRVFVAGISGDRQEVRGVESFYALRLRTGDERRIFKGGRGDVNRRKAGAYLEDHSEYGALVLLDLDMRHPPDLVERLRSHGKDLVCGWALARDSSPLHSTWLGVGNGRWPWPPIFDLPAPGLNRIGMSGHGSAFISRRAYLAVKDYLPAGDETLAIGAAPAVTGNATCLGSDYRFYSIAQQVLGFELWGDGDVESLHAITFWAGRRLFGALRLAQSDQELERSSQYTQLLIREKGMDETTLEARIKTLETRLESVDAQLAQTRQNVDFLDRNRRALLAVISEDKWLIEQMKKEKPFPEAPPDERRQMTENRLELSGATKEEVILAREGVARRDSAGWVDVADGRRAEPPNGR